MCSLGNLSKTCTSEGWTEMHPLDIALNCGYNANNTGDDVSTAPPHASYLLVWHLLNNDVCLNVSAQHLGLFEVGSISLIHLFFTLNKLCIM